MFLGSAGAFLLYVSVLSILTVLVILTAAMLMFQLGVLVERHRQVPEIPPETAMPKLQEPHAPLNVRLQA
jgi:hypothetical protein